MHQVTAGSYLAENTIKRPNTVALSPPKTYRVDVSREITFLLKPNTLAVLRFEGRVP